MKKVLLLLLLNIMLVGPVLAQAVPIDYSKAHFSWTEVVGVAPTSYTMKCGTVTGGPYTLTKNYVVGGVITTTAGLVPVSDLITASGNYFCVVTASDAIGESANSTEISFQAGLVPPAPTLTLK